MKTKKTMTQLVQEIPSLHTDKEGKLAGGFLPFGEEEGGGTKFLDNCFHINLKHGCSCSCNSNGKKCTTTEETTKETTKDNPPESWSGSLGLPINSYLY